MTGKESQAFVGSTKNLLLFAVAFAILGVIARQFCNKWQLDSTEKLVKFVFPKGGKLLHLALLGCFFVCLVTTLATVQSSLAELFEWIGFPLFSAVVATISAVVLKGNTRTYTTLSTIAFTGAFVTFLLVSLQKPTQSATQINPLSTLLYSLFSLTMVLPVLCRISHKSTVKGAISVLLSTVTVTLLLLWVEKVADFSLALPIGGKATGITKVCLCLTICLCGVSGAVASALPICEGLCDVISEGKLLRFIVLGLGWAFSCLGLDVLLKYGYLFVAFVGLLITIRCIAMKNPHYQSSRENWNEV